MARYSVVMSVDSIENFHKTTFKRENIMYFNLIDDNRRAIGDIYRQYNKLRWIGGVGWR